MHTRLPSTTRLDSSGQSRVPFHRHGLSYWNGGCRYKCNSSVISEIRNVTCVPLQVWGLGRFRQNKQTDTIYIHLPIYTPSYLPTHLAVFPRSTLSFPNHNLAHVTLDIMFSAAALLLLVLELVADAGAVAHGSDSHAHGHAGLSRRASTAQIPLGESTLTINGIPYATRAHWMRKANRALPSACPFAAFGTVIVNHTDPSGLGELVCTGANSGSTSGNPTMHGRYLLN